MSLRTEFDCKLRERFCMANAQLELGSFEHSLELDPASFNGEPTRCLDLTQAESDGNRI
jgi:hypothetical protein